MDTATCPTNVLDGKTNPSAACNCGTNAAVPVTTAQWCLVPANSVVGAMKTKVQCTPSTAAAAGTAAAAAGCLCGSDGVAIAENKFCGIKTDGTGLQMDTATCPTNVLDGKTNPSAACNCGTNAAVPVTTAQWCLVPANSVVGAMKTKVQCTPSTAAAAGTAAAAAGCLCGSDGV